MSEGIDVCDTSKWETLPVSNKHGDEYVGFCPLVTDVEMRGGWHLNSIGIKWWAYMLGLGTGGMVDKYPPCGYVWDKDG